MLDREDDAAGGFQRPEGRGLIAMAVARVGCALEAEADRWFLWLPVFFAAGIITYFALPSEPALRPAASLVLAALGFVIMVRHASLGLALGIACLTFAFGFTDAKLRTEQVRAPVLTEELRHVPITGFVELFEHRSDRRDRLTLRVIAIGGLVDTNRPYRVRVSTAAKHASFRTGEAVSLRATLRPPPEPVEPGGFDFARRAWFDRLGATGYATGRIEQLPDAPKAPLDLSVWAAIDALRAAVNDRVRAPCRTRRAPSQSRSLPAIAAVSHKM